MAFAGCGRCHFDLGITHFDLANNYGLVYGSAEENFGRIMESDMRPYRDEVLIATKAGHDMWKGPYGDGGSRKYLMASLDQSLKRMRLDYVDIFYHHRPDTDTPLEETMEALSDIVRQGKALYVGISKYSAEQTRKAAEILARNHTPLLIHQFRYNMMDRRYETEGLKSMAGERGQTLAEMALCWNLRGDNLNTVLIGASRPEQIENNVKILTETDFSEEELKKIDEILAE